MIAASGLNAQNIGQQGDSLVNYIDINGNKQGYWKKSFKNGNTAYEGYFFNNVPVGTFKRFHENGKINTILNCRKDTFKCKAELFYANQKLAATGNYYQQKKDSIWTYYGSDNMVISIESYKKGIKHGKFITYYAGTQQISEVKNYKDGVEHGIWRKYFSSGKVRLETKLKEGKRNGLFYVYYDSGRVRVEGHYVNDLRSKTWIFYQDDKADSKKFEIEYINGKAQNQEEIDRLEKERFEEYEKNRFLIEEPEETFRKMYDGSY